MVIETMLKEKLSYRETARRFEVNDHHRIQDWERIYLAEGPEGDDVIPGIQFCNFFPDGKPLHVDAAAVGDEFQKFGF